MTGDEQLANSNWQSAKTTKKEQQSSKEVNTRMKGVANC
jgi:hypothetical protein